MVAKTDSVDISDGVMILERTEFDEIIDDLARKFLDMSREEFMSRFREGSLGVTDNPMVSRLIMLAEVAR